MTRKLAFGLTSLALCCSIGLAQAGSGVVAEMSSAFTYQGRITYKGAALDGPADITFTLFNASTGGQMIGTPVSIDGYPVDHGLVAIDLDFGANAFSAQARWIEVRVNGVVLSPRQPVRAAPVAAYALSGNPGATGPQGPMGPMGLIGPVGPSGAIGPAGETGPAGAAGPTGAAGPAGATGPVGPAGEAGAIGPAGPAGATGPAGLMGPTGPAGAQGAQGPEGPIGPQGAQGPEGPAGAIGATGPQGIAGDAGPAGPTGDAGPTGPMGPAGADGATGPTGPTGATGPAGSDSNMHMFSVVADPGSICGDTQDRVVLDNFGTNEHIDAQLVVTPVVVFNGLDPMPAAGATYVAYYNDGSDLECPIDRWVLRQITAGNLAVTMGQKFNVLYTVQPL
jgi:hypothetical protein